VRRGESRYKRLFMVCGLPVRLVTFEELLNGRWSRGEDWKFWEQQHSTNFISFWCRRTDDFSKKEPNWSKKKKKEPKNGRRHRDKQSRCQTQGNQQLTTRSDVLHLGLHLL